MKLQQSVWAIVVFGVSAWIGACSSDPDTTDSGMGGGGAGGETSSGGATSSGGSPGGGDGLGGGGLGGLGGESSTGSGSGGSETGGDSSTGGDASTGGSPQSCGGTVPGQCSAQGVQAGCEAVGCSWNDMTGNCTGMGGPDLDDCSLVDVTTCAEVAGCTLN